mmetsp:Transcript_5318/g.13907  ORF Transcript_5318/g.13907 Transcript_5318/m.13907 type:complete len:218 (+) Transcript_5318:222-875(+)
MATSGRLYSAAAERNRGPILDVLRPRLSEFVRKRGKAANVLEVAAGSGQHAAFLASRLGRDSVVQAWHPTDLRVETKSVCAWVDEEEAREIVRVPRELNASDDEWPSNWRSEEITHIFVANLCHISPWAATLGLLKGAGRLIPPGGSLFVYGPFMVDQAHTASSNAAFDESLRARNESWGIRDIGAISVEAGKNGLILTEKVQMPANNFTLVLEKPE